MGSGHNGRSWTDTGHLQLSVQEPQPHRDLESQVHHVQEEDQGVGLGVEEPPHSVGQRLPQRELLGGGAGVAVDTQRLQ